MEAVADATASLARVQPVGGVTVPTYPYAVYIVALGSGETYSLAAAHGVRMGMVSVQTFGKTADSALSLMESIADRLLDKRLGVDDWDTTPCTAAFRSPRVVRDPDDNGVVGVTQAFTFAATPAPEES